MYNQLSLHRAIQENIADQIGQEKVMLEHRFPHRRADIYWPKQSLVIEIQCTPISLSSVIGRNRDYEKFGIDVVWILHQKCFNKTYLGATEQYLRTRTSYYTNIFTNNTGFIYDQEEVIDGHLRTYKSPPLKIDISRPRKLSLFLSTKKRFEIDALQTLGRHSYGFEGDCNFQPMKKKILFSQLKSKLKPLYKRFEGYEAPLMKAAFFLLKGTHLLRHLFGNGKSISLRKRNKNRWQTR